jgi:hypothetical protein
MLLHRQRHLLAGKPGVIAAFSNGQSRRLGVTRSSARGRSSLFLHSHERLEHVELPPLSFRANPLCSTPNQAYRHEQATSYHFSFRYAKRAVRAKVHEPNTAAPHKPMQAWLCRLSAVTGRSSADLARDCEYSSNRRNKHRMSRLQQELRSSP